MAPSEAAHPRGADGAAQVMFPPAGFWGQGEDSGRVITVAALYGLERYMGWSCQTYSNSQWRRWSAESIVTLHPPLYYPAPPPHLQLMSRRNVQLNS